MSTTRKAPPGFIIGAGGGGDSQEPVRTADNLLSQDYFELVLAISEGPIKGHVYENYVLENFFADNTAAVSATGDANFSDFAAMLYPGADTDGTIELKLGGTSANVPVGIQLAHNVSVTRTTPAIQRNSFNQLEVRIKFDYLVKTTTEGQYNSEAQFRIEYRKSTQTTWKNYNDESVTTVYGKTATGYVKDFIIPVDIANVDYDIRVTKISPDGVQGVDENVAALTWESFQVVRLGEQQFDDVAFMHIYGKASNQFTQVPEFSGVFDGIIVKVPTNYNPVSRTYDDGATPWNGTFKMTWTNNPVWILYELITNERYGLARYFKNATANRYEFYAEAKWCDEMVPDGRGEGGTQPRFTYNDWITEARDGMEMLRYVAGSFNAVLDDDGNGSIILRSDRPRASKHVFTPENVTPAGFGYTFSDPTTRYNDIQVAFVNPDLGWEQDWRPATIDNTAEITKFGRVPFDFIAVGCTDSWEAVRRANYRFVTATKEIATVNFTTTRVGLMCGLLDTITVADPLADWGTTGRVKSATASTIQLRDPIYFATLDARTMKVQTYSGIVEIQITPLILGENYTLNVPSSNFPVSDVPDRTTFVIEDTADMGMSKPFRVLAIEEVEGRPDEVSISAIEIAADKYEQVEQTGGYIETKYSYTTPGEPMLPAALNLYSPDPQITSDGSLIYRIEATWTKMIGSVRFEIDFKTDEDQSWNTVTSYGAQADLVPVKDGKTYTVRLYAVSPTGMRSQKCLEGTVLVESKNSSLEDVTGLTAVVTNGGWEIRWNPPTNTPDYAGLDIRLGIATDTDFFALPKAFTKDVSPQPMTWRASGTTRIMARYIDTSGNFSKHTATYDLVIQNPDTPTLNVERTLEGTYIRFPDPTTSQPLKAILVRSGPNTATWDTAVDKGSGGGNQRSVFVIPDLVADTKIFVRAQDEAGNLSNVAVQNIPAAASNIQQLIDIATQGVTFNNLADDFLEEVNLISADASVEGSVNQRLQTVTSNSTGGTYTGLLGFNFNGSLNGWVGYTASFSSFTANASSATLMANAGGKAVILRDLATAERFPGSKADKIRAKVKRIGTPAWHGKLYYGNESHSESESYNKIATEPVWDGTTGWGNVEWDMTALTAGGTDWLTSTAINYLRIDFGKVGVDNASDGFEIDFISVGSNAGADTYSLVQTESQARVDADGYLGAQWALRVALVSGGSVAAVGGIGISGTNSSGQGPRFDIAFRANTITFLPPSGVSDTQYAPFVYYTTTTVVNGVSIPAGLYLKSAFIDYIQAAQIDTRLLTIKDASGNIIFSSGQNLDYARINAAAAWQTPQLAIKRNVGDFAGTLNWNECWIHGRSQSGTDVDAPGTILVNGLITSVPNGLLYGSQGPFSGWIVWDTSLSLFTIAGGSAGYPYVAARKSSAGWEYDNNSAWTAFTPTASTFIIGTVESGAPDTGAPGTAPGIIAASMWSDAKTLDAIGNLGTTANWAGVADRPADDAIKNNMIDVSWWKRGATIPWSQNGEENIIYATNDVGGTGPRGGSDIVWYCREATGDGNSGGGWNASLSGLDPSKTYRFVVPVRVRDTGLGGSVYWGTNSVCGLNSTTVDGNPYFIAYGRNSMSTDRWYLMVGYVFPYGSVNNSNSGAGIIDCKTGLFVATGNNWNQSSTGATSHRAYQFYAGANATQLFGRPMVNVVDGTEPSLREYFEANSVLNTAVSVNADGTLNNAGGGQVTIRGIGYAGDLNAAAGVKLINHANMSIEGSTVTKVSGGGGWNAAVYSQDSYSGGAYVSWIHPNPSYSFGIGLNSDPVANSSYDTVDWWLYNSGTSLLAFSNGAVLNGGAAIGTFSAGDQLAVTYDGTNVRFMRNGAVLFTVPWVSSAPLYLDSSFDTVGGKATNIQFGPMSSNQWSAVGGKPRTYRVGAYGLGSTSHIIGSVLRDADTGTDLATGGAMYRVVKIHRTTKAVTDLGTFNPLSGALGPTGECNAMAAALNGIDNNHICVVFTYDEPSGNRMLGNLPAAMYRNGASRTVWGSAAFQYRGAYILIGIGGCGEGNGAECYAGSVGSDTNAWCDTSFQITEAGALVVSGANRGATSLIDIGYTGDANATYGATWGGNISSQPADSAIMNNNISVSGGNISGIGTGNGTAVANSNIGINSSGQLGGIGAGNGTTVSNAQINLTVNADGSLSTSGGPSASGSVTPVGIGAIKTDASNAPSSVLNSSVSLSASGGTVSLNNAGGGSFNLGHLNPGAMAYLNQITSVNVSTYIAAAAIDYSRIGVLQAGNLSVVALSNTINGGVTSTGRVEVTNNRIDVYDDSNVRRVRLGLL